MAIPHRGFCMDATSKSPLQTEKQLPTLDTTTAEWFENHYAVLARYQKHDPVHAVPTTAMLSGRELVDWNLTRYDDVAFVLKDKRFVREIKTVFGPEYPTYVAEKWKHLQESQSNWMLEKDPPNHTRLRGLVSQAFTPRMVEELRPRIQEIACDLAIQLATGETNAVDIIPGYAFALPVIVIAELLGVPVEHRDRFRSWSNLIARTLDNCTEEELIAADGAVQEIREYLRGIVVQREKEPKQDLISGLVQARDEEGRLTELELIDTCILLLLAGHETTVNLIANGLLLLAKHPEALEQLKADPTLYPSAVEEILRYEGSVQVTNRIAAEDVELGGRTLRRGDWATVWLAAANRDESHFPNPNQFDINRHPNRHLTFGGGIHFCLGATLARLEGEIALRTLIDQYPDYRLRDTTPAWRKTVTFRTLSELPILLRG